MAKISSSSYPTLTTLDGDELLPLVNEGVTAKVPASLIAASALAAANAYTDSTISAATSALVSQTSAQFEDIVETIAGLNGVPLLSLTESVDAADQRVYLGGVWEALVDTNPGDTPIGVGDGTDPDLDLLFTMVTGSCRQAMLDDIAGGLNWFQRFKANRTVVTVTNDNATGAGSLKAAIDAHAVAWRADHETYTQIIIDPDVVAPEIAMAADWEIISRNLVIDLRANPTVLDPGGTPGITGVGTTGRTLNIGGLTYSSFTASSNTTPAGNIIICGLTYDGFWGGNSGQSKDSVNHQYWARAVQWIHCSFTNPEHENTDGLFDGNYGATCVSTYRCRFSRHYKALLVYGNVAADSPGGSAWPPGHSLGAPGVYLVGINNRPEVIFDHVESHFDELHTRGPEVSQANAFCHQINCVHKDWGSYKAPSDAVTYNWEAGFPAINLRNAGAASYVANGGEMRHDGNVYRAGANASGNGLKGIHNVGGTDGAHTAGLAQFGGLFLNGATASGNTPTFRHAPLYEFTAQPASTTLEASVIARAGPEGLVNKWTYIGLPAVVASIYGQKDGVDIGPGGIAAPANTINVTGTAFDDVTYDEPSRTLTITATAGAVDPANLSTAGLLSARPSASSGTRDRFYFATDTGVMYRSNHDTPYAWVAVSSPTSLGAVVAGQLIGETQYWPGSANTAATTTATATSNPAGVPVTTAGIAASWSGIAAGTLDLVFVVPASEKVIVELGAWCGVAATTYNVRLGVCRVDAGVVGANLALMAASTSTSSNRVLEKVTLGASLLDAPGVTMTLRLVWNVSSTGTGSISSGPTTPIRMAAYVG